MLPLAIVNYKNPLEATALRYWSVYAKLYPTGLIGTAEEYFNFGEEVLIFQYWIVIQEEHIVVVVKLSEKQDPTVMSLPTSLGRLMNPGS